MMKNKLKQQKAETLVETLVALLIATLSVMMLTASITASARINYTYREADKKFAEELSVAENCDSSSAIEKVLKVGDADLNISLYGGTGRFASYRPASTGP